MENEEIFTGMTFSDEPDLVPEGDYEFVIESADKTLAKSGTTDYLKLKMKIRDDVDQSSKKRVLFTNIFKDKENPQWYDYSTLRNIILTQKPKVQSPGQPKWSVSFETCDDCVQYLVGLKLRATVVHETYINGDGEEATRAVIARGSYKASEHPQTGSATATPIADMPTDDLPF